MESYLAVKDLLDSHGVGVGVMAGCERTDRLVVDGEIPAVRVEGNPYRHRHEDEYPEDYDAVTAG